MISSEGIQNILPAQLEFIDSRVLMTLEVDEDGCVENPDLVSETPVAYVVSREWFLKATAALGEQS